MYVKMTVTKDELTHKNFFTDQIIDVDEKKSILKSNKSKSRRNNSYDLNCNKNK